MPLNRNIITPKNSKLSYQTLQNDLFTRINQLNQLNYKSQRPKSTIALTKTLISCENEQKISTINKSFQPPLNILQKAKIITSQYKQQIERTKKSIKKSIQQSQGMFLTGCGLYHQQQYKKEFDDGFETLDMNSALKQLVSYQKDDLQQLRKMIKKTNSNLKDYSQGVYKTQNEVVSAADLFGKQLNIDLKVKINKCGLDKRLEKPTLNKISTRKISSSHQNRSKIHSLKYLN